MSQLFKYIDNNQEINTVIIPGYLQKFETYASIVDILNKHSNIIFFDIFQNGFDSTLSLFDYTKMLYEYISKIQNIVLIGHSFGGRVIFNYMKLYKNNSKVILIDVAGIKYRSLNTRIKVFIYKIIKKIIRNQDSFLKNFGSNEYKVLDNDQKQRFNEIINIDFKCSLKYISNEILIIWGKDDKTTPLLLGRKIQKNIPNSELIIVPKAGHFPFIDNYIYFGIVLDKYYCQLKEGLL